MPHLSQARGSESAWSVAAEQVESEESGSDGVGPFVLRTATLGVRVRRGPDWEYGNQDGEALGTTNQLKRIYPGWILVKWDFGGEFAYRVGVDSKFDLIVHAMPEVLQAPQTGARTRLVLG